MPTGLMGVGPGIEFTGYPTIIDELAKQGITNSRAFSLDLRGVDSPVGKETNVASSMMTSAKSKTGAIIFGGIDTGKYTGHLEKRPIIPASSSPDGVNRSVPKSPHSPDLR